MWLKKNFFLIFLSKFRKRIWIKWHVFLSIDHPFCQTSHLPTLPSIHQSIHPSFHPSFHSSIQVVVLRDFSKSLNPSRWTRFLPKWRNYSSPWKRPLSAFRLRSSGSRVKNVDQSRAWNYFWNWRLCFVDITFLFDGSLVTVFLHPLITGGINNIHLPWRGMKKYFPLMPTLSWKQSRSKVDLNS